MPITTTITITIIDPGTTPMHLGQSEGDVTIVENKAMGSAHAES